MKKPAESERGTAPPPPPKRPRSILPRASEAPAADVDLGNNIWRRDRLLASIALIMGAGVILAIPLVPALEWLERRRVPSGLAAFLCLMLFLVIANAAVAAIIFPAS